MVTQNRQVYFDTFFLQRTNNLVCIVQHISNLFVAINIRFAVTVQVDIGCENTYNIKEWFSVRQCIFSCIQWVFIVYFDVAQVFDSFVVLWISYRFNLINVGRIIRRYCYSIIGCSSDSYCITRFTCRNVNIDIV